MLRISPVVAWEVGSIIWTASRSEEQQNLKQCISVMCEKQSILNKLVVLSNRTTTATSNNFCCISVFPADFLISRKQAM